MNGAASLRFTISTRSPFSGLNLKIPAGEPAEGLNIPVGGDQQHAVAQVVRIAHLAAVHQVG